LAEAAEEPSEVVFWGRCLTEGDWGVQTISWGSSVSYILVLFSGVEFLQKDRGREFSSKISPPSGVSILSGEGVPSGLRMPEGFGEGIYEGFLECRSLEWKKWYLAPGGWSIIPWEHSSHTQKGIRELPMEHVKGKPTV